MQISQRKQKMRKWYPRLAILAICTQLISIFRTLYLRQPVSLTNDTAFFEHAGWYITQGAVPYVDFWDVKPPLIHETAAVLSFITGGNMSYLHYLSVLLMSGLAVGILLLVVSLSYKVTENRKAAIVAGIAVLAHPAFHHLPTLGLWAKYFSVFFGLLAIWCIKTDRYFLAGVTGAASAGYWQFGLIFPLIVFGLTIQNGERADARNTIIGMAVITALTIAPIIHRGGFVAMMSQVVFLPFTISEDYTLLHRLGKGVLYLGYAGIVLILGIIGAAYSFYIDKKETWWIAAGLGWFGVQLLALNFASEADLFPALIFTALGVGVLVAHLTPERQKQVGAVIGAIALLSVTMLGSIGLIVSPIDPGPEGDTLTEQTLYRAEENVNPDGANESIRSQSDIEFNSSPSAKEIYRNKIQPEYCHYRLSGYEIKYLEQMNRSYKSEKCGFSSLSEALEAHFG